MTEEEMVREVKNAAKPHKIAPEVLKHVAAHALSIATGISALAMMIGWRGTAKWLESALELARKEAERQEMEGRVAAEMEESRL